jgi:hypothetical protein
MAAVSEVESFEVKDQCDAKDSAMGLKDIQQE